jgi:hypothetical protein
MQTIGTVVRRTPWNKGKLVGQKAPLKVKDIWAIRVRLQLQGRTRDLALFDLGIDSKLRGCDLVKLRVRDVCHGDRVASRTLLIHGARSAILAAQKKSKPNVWLSALLTRRHPNIAAVALANKNARTIWALLAHEREFRPDYMPRSATV